ncbi:MAG TPA: potassium-transporting ATPase subunit KdpC [Bryobacteraceae bacterium]|nr:potassium-transporting ATPase subunit KdpC [Bryobacteraceae bacterium]
MFKELKAGILITVVFTVLTGLIYPLAMTGLAQMMFPRQANGSLVERNGKVIGSELIGQNFTKPEYFHPRPSAAGKGYDATSSSGSNLGPTNPALIDRLNKGAADFRKDNPAYAGAIPADAITASGSGLDPDVTPANAMAQAARVAQARGAPLERVQRLVSQYTDNRTLGIFGEPRTNVLRLNLALDAQFPVRH